jgi:hypothetical protein
MASPRPGPAGNVSGTGGGCTADFTHSLRLPRASGICRLPSPYFARWKSGACGVPPEHGAEVGIGVVWVASFVPPH